MGVRLPKILFDDKQFFAGACVDIRKRGKDEIVLKLKKNAKPSLKEIMRTLKPSDFAPLENWGPDVGAEIID